MKQLFKLISLTFISILIMGCSGNNPFKRDKIVPIQNIIDSPRTYSDKELAIAGRVKDTKSILRWSGFILKDSTGEIFVVSSGKIPPSIGESLTVKGKIEVPASFGENRIIVFFEKRDKKK